MANRYFIEVAYKGSQYAGFQTQPNANTIQGELEKALFTFYRIPVALTGSSRTDTGVHARQNFFHTDSDATMLAKDVYHVNALLPKDIVVKRIYAMQPDAHARFDAIYRRYHYHLHTLPNPFAVESSWYYPYPVDRELLQQAALILLHQHDFTSFSKRNTQSKTMLCTLTDSQWHFRESEMMYSVQGNRFLRGMVRALVGTMMQVGRGKISLQRFEEIIVAKDCRLADFSTPPQGLFLEKVGYPDNYFQTA